jgi:hypothetical protein
MEARVQKREISAVDLIGCRLIAIDESVGAVRDLVVDTDTWVLRYLVVGADDWAPDHEVLVVPRSLAGIDEVDEEITVDLTAEQVRNSPSLAVDSPVTRDFEENWYRHYGWEDYWSAEIDAESTPEPPVPPAPPAEEPFPEEANADLPGLQRLENLRLWGAETRDGKPLHLLDLLIDDADWSIDFLEIELMSDAGSEHCLVGLSLVAEIDPVAERWYLAVDAQKLQQAPRQQHPAGLGETEVRMLPSAS